MKFPSYADLRRHIQIAAICFAAYLFVGGYAIYSLTDLELKRSLIGPFIGSSTLAFSAIWASWFAYHAMVQQRITAGLNASLNFILTTELDADFISAKLAWAKWIGSQPTGIPGLLARAHYGTASAEDRSDATKIRTFFNNFELVALGISQGILDREFYSLWQKTSFVTVWNNAAPTVGVIRGLAQNDKVYQEWEKLARTWAPLTNRQLVHPPEYATGQLVDIAGLIRPPQQPKVPPSGEQVVQDPEPAP